MTNPQDSKDTKKNKKGKKILTITLCSIGGVFLAALITVSALWLFGKANMTENNVTITPNDVIDTQVEDDNTVAYNGKKYKYNENITTILCMGIDDKKEKIGGEYVTGHAGQADAIYLLAIDTSSGKTTVLGIPRDCMAEVDLYSKSGNFVGTEKTQICLAYAYGDRQDSSAKNTAKSVSRLLYGMPVNSYFAVDDTSIAPLHNAVGPITVIPNEDINKTAISFKKGVELKLTGKNVFAYLRARNDETADASVLRLQRQLDYLKKYTALVIEKSKGDITFPVKLYNKVIKNAVTDLDVSKVTYLASSVLKNKDNNSLDFIQIQGQQVVGEDGYAEFTPDEEKLFETVLDIFYKEIKENA